MRLRTLGFAALGSVGLVALPACKKEGSAPSSPAAEAPKTEASKAEAPSTPAGQAFPDPTPRGTVTGVVRFSGDLPSLAETPSSADPACAGMPRESQAVLVREGRLKNVLVRVRGPVSGAPAASSAPVVIDQHTCLYQPRVQGAVAGQPVLVKNSDGTLHNVRGISNGKPLFNVVQPPNGKPVERAVPEDVEVLRLRCDIHPWMAAAVVVSPHPYFATSDVNGAFTLLGVPAGTYTLEAWHELLGTKTAEVTVKEGATAEVSFEFSAADAPAEQQ